MRDILTRYGLDVREELRKAHGPQARLQAIVQSSFNTRNFTHEAIASWLIFYTLALKSPLARRLLYVYQRRLHSNLVEALRGIVGERAPDVARRVAGLIDGLYLRYALDETTDSGEEAADHVLRAIAAECTEVRENKEISIDEAHPSPMEPIAKPQE